MAASRVLRDLVMMLREKEEVLENMRHQLRQKEKECDELKDQCMFSLSIRRFWGKGERWDRKREGAEGEKRLTQMLLLEPSTPTQHDSI